MKKINKTTKLKNQTKFLIVYSDIDGCIADFINFYKKFFEVDKYPYRMQDHIITKNVYKLRHNSDFWLNLPVIDMFNFEIDGYCTKRVNNKSFTKQWLEKNGFPSKPIYQQYYQRGSKSKLIKGKCDVFIDDSVSNFIECNENGVFTLLKDAPHNRWYETDKRLYTLDYEEIEMLYDKFN